MEPKHPPTVNSNDLVDIKEYMNSELIRRLLIHHPTELSLFEITCILLNNVINNSDIDVDACKRSIEIRRLESQLSIHNSQKKGS